VSPSALTTAITSTGVIEPVQTGQAAKDYLAKSVNPTLLKGLTELCKQKPIDPVVSNI
jgi:nucleoside-diphosphate kinase